MDLSPHTTRRFRSSITCALAAAAVAAPTALAATDSGTGIPAGRDRSAPSGPLVTEHSAGQNAISQAAARPVPLVTEHSAGQNLVQGNAPSVTLLTEHSAGQNRLARSSANARIVVRAPAADAFDWLDAGIGAGSTLALALLVPGAVFVVRRIRANVVLVR